MRIAAIGDIHGQVPSLKAILDSISEAEVDLILLVGDVGASVLPPGRKPPTERMLLIYHASMEEIFTLVAALGKPWAWTPGNHDLRSYQQQHGREQLLHDRLSAVGGLKVFGFGGSPELCDWPFEWEDNSFRLPRGSEEADVFLVHCPPYNTKLDKLMGSADHVGSKSIRSWLEKLDDRPRLLVCGHIHERPGVIDSIGSTFCVNAGALGQPYPRVGWVLAEKEEEAWTATYQNV